jgi:hypothetical protein
MESRCFPIRPNPRPQTCVDDFCCTNLRVGYTVLAMKKVRIPADVMKYFRKVGAMGGQTRAEKHSKEQLSAWGKLGGRPKGRRNVKKGGK